MIVSCRNVAAVRSLSAVRPFPVSRFATRVQCASRCPVPPLRGTARTTQRSVGNIATKAENALAAVKAWSEQHEVCFLDACWDEFCQANTDQSYASGRSHTLVRVFPVWGGIGSLNSNSCRGQQPLVACQAKLRKYTCLPSCTTSQSCASVFVGSLFFNLLTLGPSIIFCVCHQQANGFYWLVHGIHLQ